MLRRLGCTVELISPWRTCRREVPDEVEGLSSPAIPRDLPDEHEWAPKSPAIARKPLDELERAVTGCVRATEVEGLNTLHC